MHFEHPSALCRQLAAGELDVALVSSFEYLRNPIYSIVDGVSIASHGPVFSVILAHCGMLEALREIVIDPASETSIHLLRCLLGERGLSPEFVREGTLSATRGRLLIGDQAIRFRQESGDRSEVLDLGAEWQRFCGLPFVYALWLIHPNFAEKQKIAEALRSLGKNNLRNLEPVIAAQPVTERAFCEFYYRDCLRFTFGEAEKSGFRRFGELCVKQKLLPISPSTFTLT